MKATVSHTTSVIKPVSLESHSASLNFESSFETLSIITIVSFVVVCLVENLLLAWQKLYEMLQDAKWEEFHSVLKDNGDELLVNDYNLAKILQK